MRGGLLGGVVARGRQQDQERADLLVGQPVSVDFGIDDAGHQVVAGIVAPELRQLDARVGQQRDLRDGVLGPLLGRGVLVVAHAEQLLGGIRHRRLVGGRHAEHVHDRQHRQPRRTGGHEVDVAGPDEIVDDRDGVAVDLLLDLTDVSRRERRTDQPPVHRVLRRIHAQEERREPLDLGGHRTQCHPLGGGEQLGMLADVGDIGATCQGPEPGLLHREQRVERPVPGEAVGGAQLGEYLVAPVEGPTPEVARRDVERTVFTDLHGWGCHRFSVTLR